MSSNQTENQNTNQKVEDVTQKLQNTKISNNQEKPYMKKKRVNNKKNQPPNNRPYHINYQYYNDEYYNEGYYDEDGYYYGDDDYYHDGYYNGYDYGYYPNESQGKGTQKKKNPTNKNPNKKNNPNQQKRNPNQNKPVQNSNHPSNVAVENEPVPKQQQQPMNSPVKKRYSKIREEKYVDTSEPVAPKKKNTKTKQVNQNKVAPPTTPNEIVVPQRRNPTKQPKPHGNKNNQQTDQKMSNNTNPPKTTDKPKKKHPHLHKHNKVPKNQNTKEVKSEPLNDNQHSKSPQNKNTPNNSSPKTLNKDTKQEKKSAEDQQQSAQNQTFRAFTEMPSAYPLILFDPATGRYTYVASTGGNTFQPIVPQNMQQSPGFNVQPNVMFPFMPPMGIPSYQQPIFLPQPQLQQPIMSNNTGKPSIQNKQGNSPTPQNSSFNGYNTHNSFPNQMNSNTRPYYITYGQQSGAPYQPSYQSPQQRNPQH